MLNKLKCVNTDNIKKKRKTKLFVLYIFEWKLNKNSLKKIRYCHQLVIQTYRIIRRFDIPDTIYYQNIELWKFKGKQFYESQRISISTSKMCRCG